MQTHYALTIAAAAVGGSSTIISDKELTKLVIHQAVLGTSTAATSTTSYALRCSVSNDVLAIVNVGAQASILPSEHKILIRPGVSSIDFWIESLLSVGAKAAIPANYSLSIMYSVA